MLPLVVTVPHHTCSDNFPKHAGYHLCDYAAGDMARRILDAAQKQCDLRGQIHYGDVHRRTVDLNREPAADDPWWMEVEAALQPGSVLVDSHSYSPTSERFSDAPCYVLDGKTGRKVAAQTGCGFSPMNDTNLIVPAARRNGAKAILLETNERLNEQERQALAEKVARWACSASR